jgi:hypothetical protein
LPESETHAAQFQEDQSIFAMLNGRLSLSIEHKYDWYSKMVVVIQSPQYHSACNESDIISRINLRLVISIGGEPGDWNNSSETGILQLVQLEVNREIGTIPIK